MSINNGITDFLIHTIREEDAAKKAIKVDFWKEFYLKNLKLGEESDKSANVLYKDFVVNSLEDFRKEHPYKPYPEEALKALQLKIEGATILFDEENIHVTCNHIMRELIHNDQVNAKDYLLERLTTDEEREVIGIMGQYTLEAIIVYVISQLYSSETSMIRVSTLVDHLERYVRSHALLVKERYIPYVKLQEERGKMKLNSPFPLGVILVEFIVSRGMMSLELSNDRLSSVPVSKSKGNYYIPKLLYAIYHFDISLLPHKMNIPMVCKPKPWTSALRKGKKPQSLTDLKGGYLSGMSELNNYKLMSSHNPTNYYINIEENHEVLCEVMNALQQEPFRIHDKMLTFIEENYQHFVDAGLLMPKGLHRAKLKELSVSLREFYMQNHKGIRSIYTYDELLNILHKDVQRARFEYTIIKISTALKDYQLFLPVFLDFRGRIYRCGLLHFHERDFVRSLLIFDNKEPIDPSNKAILKRATAFHYKSFNNYIEGDRWILDSLATLNDEDVDIYVIMDWLKNAKKPFQFLSVFLAIGDPSYQNCVPITQDASSSAYQIMSYLLLDRSMALQTNLIRLPTMKDEIQDIYSHMLIELKDHIIHLPESKLSKDLKIVVYKTFNRQLVKSMFMPIIYGKTLMSTASDLRSELSKYVTKKDSFTLAGICFDFWRSRYKNMDCLIRLIRTIGWVVSSRGAHVLFRNKLYTTVQRYMKMETVNVWIYDKKNKKRRQVTLRLSSDKNDRRKTEIATFVNFIHQLDAYYAMNVIYTMLMDNSPIYTVHDNFISVPNSCLKLPSLYLKAIQIDDPLSIINSYIFSNVMEHLAGCEELSKDDRLVISHYKDKGVIKHFISSELLSNCLKLNKPKDITKKKDNETWDNKIKIILSSYESYREYISINYLPYHSQGDAHKDKENYMYHYRNNLNEFVLLMKEYDIDQYCLHY